MIRRFRYHFLALASVLMLSAAVPQASAQQVADPGSHPASKVAQQYVTMMFAQQYDKGVDIMDESYLQRFQKGYIQRTKHASTIDEEDALVRRLHKEKVEDIEKMTPREFYIAHYLGLQEAQPLPPEALAKIKETLKFKILSVAQEGDKLAHVLVRSTHSNGRANVDSLDLVSLQKNGDKWQIAPNLQEPKITKADESSTTSKEPVADPVKKPAADPVKPTPAPKPPKRKTP